KINTGLTGLVRITRIGRRNEKGKRAAGGIGACQFDAAVVGFGDPTAYGKAETSAARGRLEVWPRFFDPIEAFEDARLKLRRNPRSVIGNTYGVEEINTRTGNSDLATFRRVLDRVIEKIDKHSAEKRLVSGDEKFRNSFTLQGDLL